MDEDANRSAIVKMKPRVTGLLVNVIVAGLGGLETSAIHVRALFCLVKNMVT